MIPKSYFALKPHLKYLLRDTVVLKMTTLEIYSYWPSLIKKTSTWINIGGFQFLPMAKGIKGLTFDAICGTNRASECQETCKKKSAYLISKLPDSVSVVVFWGKNSFHGEIKSQASSLVSDSSLFGIARSCLF